MTAEGGLKDRMNVIGLFKEKIERMAKGNDQALLDFLSILFCCGGQIPHYSHAFHYYIKKWGEEKFETVKDFLIREECLLRKSQEGFEINHPEPDSVAEELGNFLFEKRLAHYGSLLKSILSYPEGKYSLLELAKIKGNIREEDLAQLSRRVGETHYNQIHETLLENSLLIWFLSSRKHDYFRLLPQIRELVLLEDKKMKEALSFIYIAQHVREPAGVLVGDCTLFQKELAALSVHSAVCKTQWYSLQGFKTTLSGDAIIKSVIDQRVEDSRSRIYAMLNKLPEGLQRYLIEHVALAKDSEGRFLQSPAGYFRDRGDNVFCLLDDDRVRSIRDKAMNSFVERGLAVSASSYVSTKGGRIDEPVFVLASELKDLLSDYLRTHGAAKPLFPLEMERVHTLFHILGDWVRWTETITRGTLEERAVESDISIEEEINKLIRDGLLVAEDESLRVKNIQSYNRALANRYRNPLVDYLMQDRHPVSIEHVTEYEVALSFAGEDREYVERVARYLKDNNVKVFYDKFEEVELWGKDLTEHLDEIYGGSSKYCVIFISENYADKIWPTHERRCALAKALREREEYILPVRFDDTPVPGIRPTLGYVDLKEKSPDQLGRMILEKIRELPYSSLS